jgi:glycosyltransferase involved in cell wall biosynthesis
MVRVLQAMAGATHGGAEAFFTRLVVALAHAGLEQRAVIRRHEERSGALRQADIDVKEIRFGGPLDIRSGLGLRREIERFRPDVVLSWMNRATRSCPRGDFVHCARLGGYYKLKHYKRCDHLIGNTRGIVDYLVDQGWPADRAHYLPNFVTAERAAPVSRASLETPESATLLLALGRLHDNKGFDVLIEAMAALPDAWLWIAGSGPRDKALKDQAQRLGVASRIRFLGWRDDVAALLAAADIFVCPSRLEPLGNVVLEACAHDVPVVATDHAGPAELISDGKDGLLVPVEDAPAIAAAVECIVSDRALAEALTEAGRATYQANYTEAAVVRRYMDFFAKVTA